MTTAKNPPRDSRRARSEATQQALMRAAEKLIAEHGVAEVSIKDIVAAAGQKNESALQYHFGSLAGLLRAIHDERSEQVRAKRAELLANALDGGETPNLRQLCALMVAPTFQLARANPGFRRYIKAFGHQLAQSDASPLDEVQRIGGGGESGLQTARLLQQALPELDASDYRRWMESAVTLCAASMVRHTGQKNAFRGPASELFLNQLIDALCGLLGAPVSKETQALKAAANEAR